MLTHLPVELFCAVIELINDKQSLSTLLLTSRGVYLETVPLFYQQACFTKRSIDKADITLRLQGFRESIAAFDGRLSLHVKRLAIVLGGVDFPNEARLCLSDILGQLVSLEEFVFDYQFPIGCAVSLPIMCSSTIPFSLKRLTWNHPVFDVDSFARFLDSQQSLQQLNASMLCSPISVSSEALRDLCVLDTRSKSATEIIPTRRVTHLRIKFVHELEALPEAEELQTIRIFSCLYGGYQDMIALTSRMHQLEYLELRADESVDAMWPFIHGLVSTKIRCLRLPGCLYFSSSLLNVEIASECFKHLPTLRMVEFQKTIDEVYERWYRDVGRSIWVRWPCGWDWLQSWEHGHEIVRHR